MLYIDRFGVEVRGIERVKPQDRNPHSLKELLDAMTMYVVLPAVSCEQFSDAYFYSRWLAANMTVRIDIKLSSGW